MLFNHVKFLTVEVVEYYVTWSVGSVDIQTIYSKNIRHASRK